MPRSGEACEAELASRVQRIRFDDADHEDSSGPVDGDIGQASVGAGGVEGRIDDTSSIDPRQRRRALNPDARCDEPAGVVGDQARLPERELDASVTAVGWVGNAGERVADQCRATDVVDEGHDKSTIGVDDQVRY